MFDISSITLSKAKAVNRLGQMPLDSARARLFPVYFAFNWSVKRISVKTWNKHGRPCVQIRFAIATSSSACYIPLLGLIEESNFDIACLGIP